MVNVKWIIGEISHSMKKKYSYWPKPRLKHSQFNFSDVYISHSKIERDIESMYPNTSAVLVSSGRCAISLILESFNFKRNERVFTNEFSSHCVIEAISRFNLPIFSIDDSIQAALVYHHWGFRHNAYKTGDSHYDVIDDYADSLLVPGHFEFSKYSKYALLSLPKIYGCPNGGLILCKYLNDAKKLRTLRDNRSNQEFVYDLLRMYSLCKDSVNPIWSGVASSLGRVSRLARVLIYNSIKDTNRLVTIRMKNLKTVSTELSNYSEANGIIPCCLPLYQHPCVENFIPLRIDSEELASSHRNFNRNYNYNECNWVKVLPLPVHQDLNPKMLSKACEIIRNLRMTILLPY